MNIRWKNIFPKYIGFLAVTSIIPLIALSLVFYQYASQAITSSANEFSNKLVDSQLTLIENKLNYVENLINNISSVEDIINTLDDEFLDINTYTELSTQAKIGYILNSYLNLDDLVSIDIFTLGGTQYHIGDTLNVNENREEIKSLIWQETLASPKPIHWSGILKNVNNASSHKMVLGASKIITQIDHITLKNRPIAMILVNINLSGLNNSLLNNPESSISSTYLIDQRDNIAYSHLPNELGQPAKNIFPFSLNNKQSLNRYNVGETHYFVQIKNIDKYNWKILTLIPEKKLLSQIDQIGKNTFYFVLVAILLASLGGWYFSHNIVRPIKNVINAFKELQHSSFKAIKRLPASSDDEIGELVKWFNTFLDNLGAQKLSEEALKESQERYALVAKATNEGLWDWNIKNNMIYCSPRFFALIGENETNSQTLKTQAYWYSLIHEEDINFVKENVIEHLTGNSPYFQCEHRIKHKDGSFRWVRSRGLAVRDDNGKAVRMAGSYTDISSQKQAEQKLIYDAFHDTLTGLYNRAWFISYLQKLLDKHSRGKDLNSAVLFIDLDKFKIVNDGLGHATGDELLIQVTSRLQACIRDTDLLARFGGDEFVLLLEYDENYRSLQIAERIIKALSYPFTINNNELYISASIGINAEATGYKFADQMIRDTDIAMYQAKDNGKNCYVVFDKLMRSQLLDKIQTEKLLREAIQNNELTLNFQPVISLTNAKLVGFETLLRWESPILGNVSPDVFIPLAEANGTIIQLGQWIFESAFRQWQAWKKQYVGFDNLVLSINMSAVQFLDTFFLKQLPVLLETYNIKGKELAIEITETAIIRDKVLAAQAINHFKLHDISIHLDDFGTGYSSLSHLAEFHIDHIKIDRSFISYSETDSKENKFVKAILNFSNTLNIKCTAEGIESAEQLALLTDLQCNYGQGHFIWPAMPAEELTPFIKQHLKPISEQPL